MLFTPYFGGCKYTNNFLFINNNIEIQRLVLLITLGFLKYFMYIWCYGQEMDNHTH